MGARKVSIGFQNIEGLRNGNGCKLLDIKEGLSNDIEILCDVWGCSCDLNFNDVNYLDYLVKPQKHTRVKEGRKSGGFLNLYKDYLAKNVKVLENSNNFVWIEVDKSCITNMENNLIIVATYINDMTSTYYDDKICQELCTGILKFGNENTPMLLMGGFIGRVGGLDDRYIDSTPLDENIPTPKLDFDIPIRRNCDTVINSHGKKFMQLCHSLDLIILNGRRIGDAIGNLTFMNANSGTSAIDYSLCNGKFYECVENFLVLPLTELSDHSKIVTIFKSSISIPKLSSDTYKWINLNLKNVITL